MIILISNDDGYAAKGLDALLNYIKPVVGDTDARVIVIAPEGARSGFSSAMTHDGPLRLRRLPDHQSGAEMMACSGTPVDCIKLGLHLLKEQGLWPDLILSGINHGSNSAVSVTYSGTMGCAIEGATNNIPAIGFSLLDWAADADFSPCRKVVEEVTRKVIASGLPERVCLNVNIPAGREPEGIKTVRAARGYWTEEYKEYVDPHGRPFYWLTGHFHNIEPDCDETDEYWLRRGVATIVAIPADIEASPEAAEAVEALF